MEQYFIHPRNWRPVLEKFPKLKLNLAHFGGDEWGKGDKESDFIAELILLMDDFPNVYTDLACFDLKKNTTNFAEFLNCDDSRKYLDRIMFGTDWYLILIVLTKLDFDIINYGVIWAYLTEHGLMQGKEYSAFCLEMKSLLDPIDFKLWIRFTILNPIKFYGLDNPILLDNLMKGMQKELDRHIAAQDPLVFSDREILRQTIKEGRQKFNDINPFIEKLEKLVKGN